ncbi:MAG: PQQ-binding-like beta-propeller repeat protein, partial [Phycisphaerae bacterium]
NPFLPGDIVWAELIGSSSGATPAYHDGVAYVATRSGPDGAPAVGTVYAFDVNASAGLRLLWSVGVGDEFFGGVTYAGGFVYAASYDFDGSDDNSQLVKIRAADGVLQWIVPCERTSSIPIVCGDRIYLSAGLFGFSSAPKVQAFRDDGTTAVKLWDTYVDTCGALLVGGWTHQPARVGNTLYVGLVPSSGLFGPYTDLFLLDLTLTPVDAGFVMQQRSGFGSSPALSDGRLYTIGAGGLNALAAAADFSGDGLVDGDDVQGFVDALDAASPDAQQLALADLDGDLDVDSDDSALFVQLLLQP